MLLLKTMLLTLICLCVCFYDLGVMPSWVWGLFLALLSGITPMVLRDHIQGTELGLATGKESVVAHILLSCP